MSRSATRAVVRPRAPRSSMRAISSSPSMLMVIPSRTAAAISARVLLLPFITTRARSVPPASVACSSPSPKQSPPAPSCDSTARIASAVLALIAYITLTGAPSARRRRADAPVVLAQRRLDGHEQRRAEALEQRIGRAVAVDHELAAGDGKPVRRRDHTRERGSSGIAHCASPTAADRRGCSARARRASAAGGKRRRSSHAGGSRRRHVRTAGRRRAEARR